MANYTNPLHPPINSTNTSSFTAIGSAVRGPPSAPRFLVPNRKRLPQAPWAPASKWKTAAGRTQALNDTIHIDYKGYSRQGVPMTELCARGPYALEQMLQGATDRVLAHTQLKRITFRILWPGYEHVEWCRSIEVNTSGGPITRAEIAQAVALNFARYCEKTQYESTNLLEWRIGPCGIRFENLVLVSIWNAFEDAWQADVAVDV